MNAVLQVQCRIGRHTLQEERVEGDLVLLRELGKHRGEIGGIV